MSAIKQLQEKIGVTPDGVFGPKSIKAFMDYFKLSKEQTANFLGQCYHETGGFKLFSENLKYSKDRLLKVFPKYFNESNAKDYAMNPEKIGNRVYANRMENGAEKSGDGYKFRGRGALQTTGRANYQALANNLKDPSIMENPDQVADKYAFESAMFYFTKNRLWGYSESVSDSCIKNLTRMINGGYNGLDDRKAQTLRIYNLIK